MASRSHWKPTIWLIALDLFAVGLLLLGLLLRLAPDDVPVAGLSPAYAMPLMIVGGALVVFSSLLAVRSILAHRRS